MGEHLTFHQFLRLVNMDITVLNREEQYLPDEAAYMICCEKLQQIAEKLLKASILIYGEYPEYSHNIGKLRLHCERLNINLPESISVTEDSLTTWEASSRYDPDFEIDSKKYIRVKDSVIDLIEFFNEKILPLLPEDKQIIIFSLNHIVNDSKDIDDELGVDFNP